MAKRIAKMPKPFSTMLTEIAMAITKEAEPPVYPILHSFHLHNLKIFEGCVAMLSY